MVAKFGIAYPACHSSFMKGLDAKIISSPKEIKDFDVVIFTGGEDICPRIYGQEPTHTTYWNDHRDSIELRMLNVALELGKKILGSCRGHQLINAYLGGSLVQDLFFEAKVSHGSSHSLFMEDRSNYSLRVKTSDIFHKMQDIFTGDVNSMHHQGIRGYLGSSLLPVATHKSIVEIAISSSGKIISTQFHPEWMSSKRDVFFDYLKEWGKA